MTKQGAVEVKPIDVKQVKVEIRGLSPVILHRWSEKQRKNLLDRSMGKTVKKEPKNPEKEFEQATYKLDDGRPGFPADGFKAAMVRGAKQLGLVMTDMKTGFFVHGEFSTRENRELVPLKGDLIMREDPVPIQRSGAEMRYRGQVNNWSTELHISYNKAVVTDDYIVHMIEAAGYGVGIGDWRPERDGVFGRFEVVKQAAK